MPQQQRSTKEEQKNQRGAQTSKQERLEEVQPDLLRGKTLLLDDARLAHPANLVRRAELLRIGQQTLGNRALQRMLHAEVHSPCTQGTTPIQRFACEPMTAAVPLFGPGPYAWGALERSVLASGHTGHRLGNEAGAGRERWEHNWPPLVALSAPTKGVIQRDPDDEKTVARPTLSVAPGDKVTRGTDVTLTINFTPKAGETLNVKSWKFTSPGGDTVNRSKKEADFQSKWQGPLVLPGAATLKYAVQPAQGSAVDGQLSKNLKVKARTGGVWASSVAKQAEQAYGGQPSPPERFSHLGHHAGTTSFTIPGSTKIAGGPNKDFRYIKTLTAGTYKSQPSIHPDLTNPQSNFYKFHLQGSRLYVVKGKQRKLVPTSEYSNLSLAGGTLTFNIPNWEKFYQKYDILKVTAKAGKKTITCQPGWWKLASNAQNANVQITNDAAVRKALGIGPQAGFTISWQPVRTYVGYKLITSADLLHGTRRHEYQGAVHSHRANFLAAMRALDPQRKLEEMVSTPQHKVNFSKETKRRFKEIDKSLPTHEIVDEAQSKAQESLDFRVGVTMHDVNEDDAGNFLGSAWHIKADKQMTN